MGLIEFLVLLLIAGICGALGQALTGYSRGGCLAAIAVGFIGALIGMFLARLLHLPEWFTVRIGTVRFPVIWSVIGSVVFVGVLSLFSRRTV